MLTHYAEACNFPKNRAAREKAFEAAERYRTDPSADMHQMLADMCGLERDPAKTINLALCYGMGSGALARDLGLPTVWRETVHGKREMAGPEAQALLDTFNEKVPFIAALADMCEKQIKKNGYIVTILGRRLHFPKKANGIDYDWLYKGINRLLQGGCGDQMKKAMVLVHAAKLPMQLQVHDELDTSIDHPKQAYRIGEIMENAVQLRVPSKVDLEVGPNWGNIEKMEAA